MSEDPTLPDYIAEAPDGSLTITLRGGHVMTMREPTVEDQLSTKGTPEQREISLVGNLCELTPDEMKKMTARNYRRVQAALKYFFD